MPYQIRQGEPALRQDVARQLAGLDLIDAATREKIVTAWVSTLTSSDYARLEDVPWDPSYTSYRLIDHVNEVTRNGIAFAEVAAREWGHEVDHAVLVPILILHDVDKPLLFTQRGGETVHSALFEELPHGVIGGMLLKELGFARQIVAAVSTHSPAMPFRGKSFEAYILFYADHFSCDNALLKAGMEPTYRRLRPPG